MDAWYLAPRFFEPGGVEYVVGPDGSQQTAIIPRSEGPGTGNPMKLYEVPVGARGGMSCFAYDAVRGTVLVKLGYAPAPADWTAITVVEARHYFERVAKRAPTEREVPSGV